MLFRSGEEAIESGTSRGRSDAMIVLSMNKADKSVKMISFLRDCLVELPGYLDNKMNDSYMRGGGPFVMEVIETNFNLQIDGYIHVGFDNFQDVIDRLGGVDIELTEEEAEYLCNTNYISMKKYRNVKPGWNTMNGNQALGYCRVRKRREIGGENDEIGRAHV